MRIRVHSFSGYRSLVEREVARFVRVIGQTVLSPLINASLYLLVFGVSLSSLLENHQGLSYLHFIVPGLVALGAINNALQNSSSSIIISKFHGDLQDLRIVPMRPLTIGFAYATASWIRGLLVGALVYLIGSLFIYIREGVWLELEHPLILFVFLSLSCLIFGNLGIFAGFVSRSFDQINALINWVIMPLIYLGGVFFSLEVLHPFWQNLALFNPLVYLINGIRYGILGISDVSPTICLIVALGAFVVSTVLASIAVHRGSYQRF